LSKLLIMCNLKTITTFAVGKFIVVGQWQVVFGDARNLFGRPKQFATATGKIAPKSQFLNFMETENSKNYNRGGRLPKTDPYRHCYLIKLNDEDNARFLAMLNETGLKCNAAKFIKTVLFKREIKYVKIDKAAIYYMRLTNFYSQYRAIGVNYNQVVKHLKTVF